MRNTIVAALLSGLVGFSAYAEECPPEEQVEALALTIYHEARGEDLDSQQLVGEVVLNRVESVSYPDTICDVVYQKNKNGVPQFSFINENLKPKEKEAWETAEILAEDLLSGEIQYFDNGATHFINPNGVSKMPGWTKKFKMVGKHGKHIFYADGSKKENMYFYSSHHPM